MHFFSAYSAYSVVAPSPSSAVEEGVGGNTYGLDTMRFAVAVLVSLTLSAAKVAV